MGFTAQPGTEESDPGVAAAVRLLHRRHGWTRVAITSFIAFFLAAGGYANAKSQGAPPPPWYLDMVFGIGALTVASIIVVAVDSARLRGMPVAVQTRAAPIAAHHPGGPRAHHFPPRHLVTWILRWVGMLLILGVAVVSVPGPVDGVAYLTGAERTVTFDPVSHQTNCDQYSCQSSTVGILETGGAGVSATWPSVVPLGKPFQVREPLWKWGLGGALIDSDGIAVAAVVLSLLIEAAAVLVLVYLVRLARNWRRHRQRQIAIAPAPTS